MTILILASMLYMHIIDDYVLQGILATLKQKKYWEDNFPGNKLYENDYKIALLEHAFSWSFSINIPILIYLAISNTPVSSVITIQFIVNIVINTLLHAMVDHFKANDKVINLISDQSVHIVQIIITWLIWNVIVLHV